jgi:2,3-diketo-5-methylthio-1-phosphopentane phosphatase
MGIKHKYGGCFMRESEFETPNLDKLQSDGWSIVCDFDGTITPFDITDAILQKFAPSVWEDIEDKWLRGEITARQCMERQVSILKAPVRSLNVFLDSVPLTEGFREFIRFCRENSLQLQVVSDGMDYAIKRILANHGLCEVPVIANRLLCFNDGRYALEFPYGNAGCPSGVCKCSVAKSVAGKTLLIGDGRSDCCLAGIASFTLAREGETLQRHCVKHGYHHSVFADFYDILADLEKLPRPVEAKDCQLLSPACA